MTQAEADGRRWYMSAIAFDLPAIPSLLRHIDSALALGIDTERLADAVAKMPLPARIGEELEVVFADQRTPLRLSVIRDDDDFADVQFQVTSTALLQAIEGEIARYCKQFML